MSNDELNFGDIKAVTLSNIMKELSVGAKLSLQRIDSLAKFYLTDYSRHIHREELKKMLKYIARISKKIRNATSKETSRRLENTLMRSLAFKIISYLLIIKGGEKNRISYAELRERASKVRIWEEVENPEKAFRRHVMEKDDGGFRVYCSYNDEFKARQQGLMILAVAKVALSKKELAQKGKGLDYVKTEISKWYKSHGIRTMVNADILDCYQSTKKSAIKSVFNFSDKVIRNSIMFGGFPGSTKDYSHTYDNIVSEITEETGLPQGARHASLFSSAIINDILSRVPGFCKGNYADNIGLGAKNKDEAKSSFDTLKGECLNSFPGSPFFLKEGYITDIGEVSDTCGLWIRPNPIEYGGGVNCTFSYKHYNRYYKKLALQLFDGKVENTTAAIEAKITQTVKAFKDYANNPVRLEEEVTRRVSFFMQLMDNTLSHAGIESYLDSKSKMDKLGINANAMRKQFAKALKYIVPSNPLQLADGSFNPAPEAYYLHEYK